MSPVSGNKVSPPPPDHPESGTTRMPSEARLGPPSGHGLDVARGPTAHRVAPGPALLVVGGSARAWASSVRRTGLGVHAADLFADRDLLAIAAAVAIQSEDYPLGLAAAAATFPPGPWCYTGALENHPALVDEIATTRFLAGNGGEVLRHVRSHRHLAAALSREGIGFPRTLDDPSGLPTDGTWLRKPRAGAGGQGITVWSGPVAGARAPGRGEVVWQERIPGLAVAGVFVVSDGAARLVGASRQWIGDAAWHATGHAYCGSVDVDPGTLPDRLRDDWARIGSVLADAFGVRGVVGVDAIVAPSGRLVVIEVNPRPTASMELIDRRTGFPLAAEHLAAFGIATAPPPSSPAGGRWTKGILRAPVPITVDERLGDRLDRLSEAWSRVDGWTAIADLPRAGSVVPAGAPFLTLFAVADTGRESCTLLDRRRAIVDRGLRRP